MLTPHVLAKLAALAYEPIEKLPAGAYIIRHVSSRAAVFARGLSFDGITLPQQVITLAGTQVTGPLVQRAGDLGDVVANVRSRGVPWEYGRGKVAVGYWHHARPMVGALLGAMRRPCILGGHSMGGVDAQILGAMTGAMHVVAFGPPRAFDPEAAASFRVPVTNYIGRQDWLATAPWWESDRTWPGEVIEVDCDHFGYVEALSQL